MTEISKLGITNIEMETSGIYLMAAKLGHRALSINVILANRISGQFVKYPGQVVDIMIQRALETVVAF